VGRRPAEQKSVRRRGYQRESRRLLVVCGSAGNEARYVKGLNRHLQNAAVSVTVAEKGCAPSQVVRYAIDKAKGASGPFDEVYCVVDVDDFGACGDLGRAVDLAAKASDADLSVQLIVSNPCFELWVILHFIDHRAHAASYEQIKPIVRKVAPNYDKSSLDFMRHGYADAYLLAAQRAKALEPSGADHSANPSTNMWQLVQAMTT
jgi:RloB-like protein